MKLYQKVSLFVACLLTCVLLPMVARAQGVDERYSIAVLNMDASAIDGTIKTDYDNSSKNNSSSRNSVADNLIGHFLGNSYRYNNNSRANESASKYKGRVITPGTSIPAILTSELAKSDRFEVVEREEVERIMREQDFAHSGRVDSETASALGEILGVEYFVMGTITEFQIEEGKTGSFHFMGIGSTQKKPDTAKVSIELKVVDTDSARIVATASCRKTFTLGKGSHSTEFLVGSSVNNDYDESATAISDLYYQIALDLAQQLNTAKFKARTPKTIYKGTVLHVDGDNVYINLGSEKNITKKMVFKVYRQVKKGPVNVKVSIAEIKPVDVTEGQSQCKVIKVEGDNKVKTGDTFESKN